MAAKITREVIESHLRCTFKAHLKLAGEHGTTTEYEHLLLESRAEVRRQAISKIQAKHGESEVVQNAPLTVATLKQGAPFLLDARLEDDLFCLHFDGLKKVAGASKLGDFHYLPILFHDGRQIGNEQRRLLELCGLLLGRVQGKPPESAVVWHGRECKATKVRLNPDKRKAEQFLRELEEMANPAKAAPRLVLNNHCQVCEFRQRCHDQAVKEDNLSLLRGMSEKEVKNCFRKGILTVAQFAHTFRPRRKAKRHQHKPHRRYHALQALAIQSKKVYVFGTPEVPESAVRVYLDVESDPEEGFVYLIGMIVVREGFESRHSFWADGKKQEALIFEQFLTEISKYDDFRVFCYGSYEKTVLKRMRAGASKKEPFDRVLDRLVNVLSLVYGHVYFPCYSNGLKDVGRCLGCRWTEPDASGLQSIVWRQHWEATNREEWKQKLLTYNQEDCSALSKVTGFLFGLQSRAGLPATQGAGDNEVPPVENADDLKAHPTRRSWCTATFLIPEFKLINECAYFDYQRDKVFLRTNKTLARLARRKKKDKGERRLPINKRIEIKLDECPHCQSTELSLVEGRRWRRILFDLKFSSIGITRKVIECVVRTSWCDRCGRAVFPERYKRMSKFQHGLKSWVVAQHVVHRVSVEKMKASLDECFGFRIPELYLLKFKDLLAQLYQSTYDGLLKRIVSGGMMHADETTIKLKTGEEYVWVFTNMEEVVYLHKPNRESTFLHELLRGFSGVLVSDFFSGYDSLPCQQQKCLIHLMRDLNHDLFHSPFDEELKSIASRFGVLLQAIVATIDWHGLRRKYLARHKKDVSRFFATLTGEHYTSEVAQGYQARFLKSQDKLFTFLDHDGVPWNNNNAEHAIKQFAYYRRVCEPHISAGGLQEYLVLLSIAQTCKYKGVSFLKFLLSRELDIDTFAHRGRKSAPTQTIDVYPPGFSYRRFGQWKRYED